MFPSLPNWDKGSSQRVNGLAKLIQQDIKIMPRPSALQGLHQKSELRCRDFRGTQNFQTPCQPLYNMSMFFSHFNQLKSSTSRPHFLECSYLGANLLQSGSEPGQMANWGAYLTYQRGGSSRFEDYKSR